MRIDSTSAVGVSLAVLASFEPFEKHRVPAAEPRSLCNKNALKTRESNGVGRDYTASGTPTPHARLIRRDSNRKKTENRQKCSTWVRIFA